MIKNGLQQRQPIVYQTLHHALTSGKVAHAYLFVGMKGTPKKEVGLLMAQSLICENKEDGFACEKCDSCRRISDGVYSDVIVLDGTEESIKKESILNLQDQFSKTALEKAGKKIYLLDAAENATIEALNSLLKFLEEPQGQNTIAILTVESLDRLLPTIVSRCQVIPFKLMGNQFYSDEAQKAGLDEIDSYLLSHFVKDVELMKKVQESQEYQMALAALQRFSADFDSKIDRFLVWFQTEILGSKESDKEVIFQFLELSSLFFRDIVASSFEKEGWYYQRVMECKSKKIDYQKVIRILLESKDKCNRFNNSSLLMEQTIYQIKEVV
ncbi:MAG: DNA polymerase III subunit delta [Anaerorhabdus sp.]